MALNGPEWLYPHSLSHCRTFTLHPQIPVSSPIPFFFQRRLILVVSYCFSLLLTHACFVNLSPSPSAPPPAYIRPHTYAQPWDRADPCRFISSHVSRLIELHPIVSYPHCVASHHAASHLAASHRSPSDSLTIRLLLCRILCRILCHIAIGWSWLAPSVLAT